MSSEWLDFKSESLLRHFGLTREPFKITPDPTFLYLSASHQQALARLLYGINARKGFIVLTGEIGTGKTTLIHCLLQELKKRNTESTLIVNTIDHSTDLLRDVCEDLGFTAFREDRQDIHTYLKLLNQLLLESYHKGKNVTLIIDEAQTLSIEVLENIRLLSNFETSEDKLLQIVLAGQLELAARLNSPELRQLKQRVVLYHHLRSLNFGECSEYIARRVEIAGGSRPIFTPEALEAIYTYSGGIPRVINVLCDNGMLTAYGSGVKRVRAAMIREIAEERSLGFQPEAAVPMKAAVGFERQRHAGPAQGITRLGRIVDEVEPEETPVPQPSVEEFTVFTAGVTDSPAASTKMEIEEDRDVVPPAAESARLDDLVDKVETEEFTVFIAGRTTDEPVVTTKTTEIKNQRTIESPAPESAKFVDRTENVEAEFRVTQPSVKEFTVFTSGATDEPAEATEIEMERHAAPPAAESAKSGNFVDEIRAEEFRVADPSVEDSAVFTAGGTTDAAAVSTKTASDLVSPEFLDFMIGSLTEAMGPMASLVIQDQVSALGEDFDAFPKSRLAELVESASREILEEPLKIRFQQVMFEEIGTMNSSKEEK